jgi:hypothetical protein
MRLAYTTTAAILAAALLNTSSAAAVIPAAPTLNVTATIAQDGTASMTVDFSSLVPTSRAEVVVTDSTGNTLADDFITDPTSADAQDVVNNLTPGDYSIAVITDTETVTQGIDISQDGDVTMTSALQVAVTDPTSTTSGGLSVTDNGDGTDTVVVTFDPTIPTTSGFDVSVFDSSGAVVAQASVDSSQSSTTFVVATDTSFTATVSTTDDQGNVTTETYTYPTDSNVTPVIDPTQGGGTGSSTIVDPATVTVTAADGGWLVSWAEPSSAPTDGFYLASDQDGYSCTAPATGTPGALDSCTLSDPTIIVPAVSVDYTGPVIAYSAGDLRAPSTIALPTIDPSAKPQPVVAQMTQDARAQGLSDAQVITAASLGHRTSGNRVPLAAPAIILGILAAALAALWTSRHRRVG